MRIYDGSPRQDFEEVFRSIGVHLDGRALKDILILEVPDGFIVQGLAHVGASGSSWSESVGQVETETMTFADEEIAQFMDEAAARRGQGGAPPPELGGGRYEQSLRVIGRYIDEERPRDVFLFEQDGAFVVRLHHTTQSGSRHTLAEFTRDDIAALIARAPALRTPVTESKSPGPARA
ncbi:MAG TPA: hypothetical protein VLS28_04360 [Candidatus Sulfomarinibacteraceae bacterium]|nr:hypothetical protein [Candidatus Sulfomarinibacteraceae bacterium]